MKKLIFIFLCAVLYARINPFVPVVKPQNTIVIKPKYFQKAVVKLPSDARILKKIVFVYQSVNGDIKSKTVTINKHIDFHKPIYVYHSPKKFPMKELNFLDLFKMYIKNRKIFIRTKDKLIRHFFLVKPFRIILDFRRDADFLTIKKNVKNSIVKKVVVGNHEGYYRVVIYFDSKYSYRVDKTQEGVKIEIK